MNTDLMIKMLRRPSELSLAAMAGIDPDSDGLARARASGIATTAEGVFAAARARDPIALAAVELEGRRLALLVAAIAAILDPELVVLGGGIGRNLDLLQEPLLERLHALTPLRPRLAVSALGNDAVLLGAIATGLDLARDLVFQRRAGDGRAAAG